MDSPYCWKNSLINNLNNMSRKFSKTELWKNNIEFELSKNTNYPKYGNNKINTSKYNPITFIPLNFFH